MRRRRSRRQISLLVPLGGDEPNRTNHWKWLRKYWEYHLPECEIVIGRDRDSDHHWWHRHHPKPFSKAVAVNDAFARSHGDIIVILDSDALLDSAVIQHCADRLRLQRKNGVRSWFVPYDDLFRLTHHATDKIVERNPDAPYDIPSPPPPNWIDGRDGTGPINIFGAMCQVLPREAFLMVGGMDPRFRGWGAEDSAFAEALDTLWGLRKNTANDILHLWHPSFTSGIPDKQHALWKVKMWHYQEKPGANDALGGRYNRAWFRPLEMRQLVEEGKRTK